LENNGFIQKEHFSMKKNIRVGVFGINRGLVFSKHAAASGLQLTAICDAYEKKLRPLCRQLRVEGYTEFDRFLEHDMDAVILSNYFHEKTPFALKCLAAGKHVMSETIPCFTLAECAALVRAVEKSKKIYMFAENYPYLNYNQEMRRLFKAGRVGRFIYGEGEYVHPMSPVNANLISPEENHWRNWIPATYYSTHSLSPIMYITDAWPAKVNGFVVPHHVGLADPAIRMTARRNDAASMITVRMDNDALVKLLQYSFRGHGIWTRIHGSLGQMENTRVGEWHYLRLRREQYLEKKKEPKEQIYFPDFPIHNDLAWAHDGCDFFMNYHFAEAIRRNEQPYLNVYRAAAMSAVAIQAYRSALSDSAPMEVPDFRKEAVRRKYANDHWSPDPAKHTKDMPWPSIEGNVKPDPKGLAFARKLWKTRGRESYHTLGE
jgi:predicted dehydrogenase